MTRKIVVDCNFQGKKVPVDFFIGEPDETHHPLHFQADFVSKKGGMVPPDVMEAMSKVKQLADKNKVPFADLCYYAMLIANGKADDMDIDDVNVLKKFDEILASDDDSIKNESDDSSSETQNIEDDSQYQENQETHSVEYEELSHDDVNIEESEEQQAEGEEESENK
jgi:hypothetical protein